MARQDLIDGLVALFEETGQAHHQAFLSTDGEDPAWGRWYAGYTHDRLEALLDIEIGETELASLFEGLEERHRQNEPDTPWPRSYAEFFAERYG